MHWTALFPVILADRQDHHSIAQATALMTCAGAPRYARAVTVATVRTSLDCSAGKLRSIPQNAWGSAALLWGQMTWLRTKGSSCNTP